MSLWTVAARGWEEMESRAMRWEEEAVEWSER